jgi:uncharacterized protein YecE (DUF72 family)
VRTLAPADILINPGTSFLAAIQLKRLQSIVCLAKRWGDRVKEDFVYAVKGNRFITHMKKLVNLDGALDKFFDRIAPMKERVGDSILVFSSSFVA